jgi:hypothetical protein
MITTYDTMIEIENVLIETLSSENEIEGHDNGAEEVNIFIHTNNALKTFDEVKAILGKSAYWEGVKVAYREIVKSQYIVLWPVGFEGFNVA